MIPDEGMPIYNPEEFTVDNFNKPVEKGNLFVKFDIIFPIAISAEKRNILKSIIKN